MAVQTASAVVLVISVCLALSLGMSHAQEQSADAPSEFKDVGSDEIFVELAPGVIEEVTSEEVLILDPTKCWKTIGKVTTCILDILLNLGKGKLDFISPKCCQGFAGISSQCWRNFLPFDDFTDGVIKDICSRAGAPPPAKLL